MCFAIVQQKLYPKNFEIARSSSYKSSNGRIRDSFKPYNVASKCRVKCYIFPYNVAFRIWHRWCSVCDTESFFLVLNNVWPHYLFMCCSYCTFLISSIAVSLHSVSSACMFH